MNNNSTSTVLKKTLSLLIALTGWFAVIAQFVLMLENRSTTVPEMIVRFFSFFTILTNILVSIYFTLQLIYLNKRSGNFFNQRGSLTAITVYITVVGLVYQVALRHLWNPTGLQMTVDELLHTVIPALVIFYWFLYEKKSAVTWKNIPKFLLYPLCYLAFILLRGAFSGFYPYPFINVMELGWTKTMANIFLLFGVSLILFLLFIGAGKVIEKRKK